MSEALEAVGDVYAIHGFTSEGRRNVKFYVVKDFSERYSDEVKQRMAASPIKTTLAWERRSGMQLRSSQISRRVRDY